MRVTAVTQRSGVRKSVWVLLILVCCTEEMKTYLFDQASDFFLFCVIWVSYPLEPKKPELSYKVSANLCRSEYVACINREFTMDVLNNTSQCKDLRHVRRPKTRELRAIILAQA